MKKILATILALVLALGLCTSAWATEAVNAASATKDGQLTEYSTLAEAITNADAGTAVTLLKNVKLDSTLKLNKNVVLDLNGYKISNGDSLEKKYYLIEIGTEADVDIVGDEKGSAIEDTRNNSTGTITAICVYGKLTIDGSALAISRSGNGIAIKVDEKGADKLGNLTVKKGTISSAQAIQSWGKTTIEGGTFNGEVNSRAYSNVAGTLTINNGDFNGAVYSGQLKYNGSWPSVSAKTNIKGGNFKGTIAEYYDDGSNSLQPIERVDKPSKIEESKVDITGGVFANDITDYSEGTGVVRFKDTYYVNDSIGDAVTEAASGDTLDVVQGHVDMADMPAGVTVKNSGGGEVTVNGNKVEKDKTYTVPTKTTGGYYYYQPTTDTKADEAKGSPKTFDAGVGIYAVTAVLSVTGMAWTAKKRH